MYRNSPSTLDDVVRSALSAARTREGRLVGVTLSAPEDSVLDEVSRWVAERLATRGVPGVEVQTVTGAGPCNLLRLEFSR